MSERIQLNGLNNTRDLGGMTGAEGRKVRRGRLIRSGHLFYADEADREILALISRRPATAEDLAVALNRDIESVRQRAETLVKAGVVSAEKLDRGVFYSAV